MNNIYDFIFSDIDITIRLINMGNFELLTTYNIGNNSNIVYEYNYTIFIIWLMYVIYNNYNPLYIKSIYKTILYKNDKDAFKIISIYIPHNIYDINLIEESMTPNTSLEFIKYLNEELNINITLYAYQLSILNKCDHEIRSYCWKHGNFKYIDYILSL